jgi:hypothetical protein
VGSNLGAMPGMLIEIDCIAYKPQVKKAARHSRSRKRSK